jgi:acetoin utilization deacetylase AcuC-like enzyme
MLTIIFDSTATDFSADFHPECPARLISTEAYLAKGHPDWLWLQPRLASEEEILRTHHPKHLLRLRQPVDFDGDTPYYPGIDVHARRVAGAAIESVDLALRGQKGFALMRPPGHHATASRAMGFCYLNSIAIAAHHALEAGCQRVAIWDFDAHLGNGTEDIVEFDLRRFTSIPAILAPGRSRLRTSSTGQSRRTAMQADTHRPFARPLSVWLSSSLESSWYLRGSMLTQAIRRRRRRKESAPLCLDKMQSNPLNPRPCEP